MRHELGNKNMERCIKCTNQTKNRKVIFEIRSICAHCVICDECVLEHYIIYNCWPIKKIAKCEFCKSALKEEVSTWLFNFTKLYFESEGPYRDFYL